VGRRDLLQWLVALAGVVDLGPVAVRLGVEGFSRGAEAGVSIGDAAAAFDGPMVLLVAIAAFLLLVAVGGLLALALVITNSSVS